MQDDEEITITTSLLNDSVIIQIDPPSFTSTPINSDDEQEEFNIESIRETLQQHSHILLPPPAPPLLILPRIRVPPRRLPAGIDIPAPTVAPRNFTQALHRVLHERRSAISDDNYINFDDLEDVRITLDINAFNDLNVINNTNDELCSICWDDLLFNAIVLPCNHLFHVECGKMWLLSYSYRCPLCKKPAGDRYTHF